MTLASLFSRGRHHTHLFVLADVERHINANLRVTILDKQGQILMTVKHTQSNTEAENLK